MISARVRRSRERVLTTAVDLLSESGVSGFTVEEVANRSGVAKTTIYRHWPSREALVLDAASRISAEVQAPDTGSVADDATAILTDLAHLLATTGWSSVVPSIVDAVERDPEFAAMHGMIQRGHAAALREVLNRAIERGQLPSETDVSHVISTLIGPLYYRHWFTHAPTDYGFIQTIVENVFSQQSNAESAG